MLKNIKLENFRSHRKFELNLDQTTVLVGENGIGKTNILEAVVIVSFGRSFREDDKKSLINFDSDFARVKADDLEIILTKTPRFIMKARERGVPRRLSDFIGCLPSVVFSPETISIITGSPSDRRRFLDIMISQVDREYLVALMNYRKIRHQRNVLLQRISDGQASEDELDFWDKELCKEGEIIVAKRGESIDFLNVDLPHLYSAISGDKKDELKVQYDKNYHSDLLSKLKEGRRQEIAYRGTIFGPHRDDLIFELNNKDMSKYASRGELKSAILALKISEINYLKKHKRNIKSEGEVKPILLLDDIFSEFDPERRKHLSNLILDHQTLITTTDIEGLPVELTKGAKIIKIEPLQ